MQLNPTERNSDFRSGEMNKLQLVVYVLVVVLLPGGLILASAYKYLQHRNIK